jgi:hypothetical protein
MQIFNSEQGVWTDMSAKTFDQEFELGMWQRLFYEY